MPYRIEFTPAARKSFLSLPRDIQRRIQRKVDGLAVNPRPPGMEVLTDGEGRARIRVGDYRVVYRIHDDVLLVLVVRVGHRREVYRKL
jgi:mRNA interferase RelE/StbE